MDVLLVANGAHSQAFLGRFLILWQSSTISGKTCM